MTSNLNDIAYFVNEKINIEELNDLNYISTENMLPDRGGITKSSGLPNANYTQYFSEGDILLSNIRPYFKKIWYATFNGGCSNDVLVLRAKSNMYSKFLYYVLSDDKFFEYDTATSKGTKMPRGDKVAIMKYGVPQYDLPKQKKIARVLSSLDDKIELNNKINQNLEQQAQAIFKSWFVNFKNPKRKTCKAEEYFNISIGKTPPRKEPEWFSQNSIDKKWVSISDMGNCGVFILNSSEYLKNSAIDKFNIVLVPKDTVILSFKLTIGRVAITNEEVTTNEAIAHFKTDNKKIKEYLYCYLKNYNFQTMGSTSSIATAVNSKIIKSMPFIIPADDEIEKFHQVAKFIFEKIRINQIENEKLTQLRDTLLPKLMSGEIDVDKVEV